jgi:hypothetical protein
MVFLEWVEPVFPDREPAFEGKSHYQLIGKDTNHMKVGIVRFKLTDYHYLITPTGTEILKAYEAYLKTVTEKVLGVMKIDLSAGKRFGWYEGEPLKKRPRRERTEDYL